MTQTLRDEESSLTIVISDAQGGRMVGLDHEDITVHYRKAGGTVEEKVMDASNFEEINGLLMRGLYQITFSATEMDTVGEFVASIKPDEETEEEFEQTDLRLEVVRATSSELAGEGFVETEHALDVLLNDVKGTGFDSQTDALVALRDEIDGMIVNQAGLDSDLSDVATEIGEIQGDQFVSGEHSLERLRAEVDSAVADLEAIQGEEWDPNEHSLDVLRDVLDNISGEVDLGAVLGELDDIKGTEFEPEDSLAHMTERLESAQQSLDDTQAVVERIVGLSKENFRITDQNYNDNNQLIEAVIEIYDSAEDLENQQNPLAVYRVETFYDIQGRVEDYRVLKLTS